MATAFIVLFSPDIVFKTRQVFGIAHGLLQSVRMLTLKYPQGSLNMVLLINVHLEEGHPLPILNTPFAVKHGLFFQSFVVEGHSINQS